MCWVLRGLRQCAEEVEAMCWVLRVEAVCSRCVLNVEGVEAASTSNSNNISTRIFIQTLISFHSRLLYANDYIEHTSMLHTMKVLPPNLRRGRHHFRQMETNC